MNILKKISKPLSRLSEEKASRVIGYYPNGIAGYSLLPCLKIESKHNPSSFHFVRVIDYQANEL